MSAQLPPEPVSHTPPQGTDRWHDLREHLQDVSNLAAQFARVLGAEQLGRYAGLWHDLGKYHPDFQAYLQRCHAASQGLSSPAPKSVPHAIHGAKWAASQCKPLAPLIYGHHSGLPAFSELNQKLQGRDKQAVAAAYQLSLECARQAGINLDANADSLKREMACVQHDPLASELFLRLLFSCLVDADFLDTEEHFDSQKTQQRRVSVSLAQLQATLAESQTQLMVGLKQPDAPVNRVRAEVYEHCQRAATLDPGVFRLCVPTGGGKTRSGLAFALNHAVARDRRRVIVAVPYTSIIEQTAKAYRDIFQALDSAAVLEHHSAVWNDRPSDRDQGDRQEDARPAFARARLIAQNWDAPLIVTTTVQLFDSLFANRPSRCRKLHNLVNSVIVLDEVQTLPIGLLDPILSVLRELVERYGVTVVLCTATQPALEADNAYLQGFPPGSVRDIVPLAQAREHFRQLQRVEYEVVSQPWSWDDLVADLNRRESDRALIVLNTRRDALAVLQALEAADWPREHLRHLSTLLCGQHRAEVLQEVRQRLQDLAPCVLVSTQVVEAGVDLDFPLVYRALGPLDRIVQAAGRCNREGKLERGQAVIFEPAVGKQPPGDYRAAATVAQRYLHQKADLHAPETFERYFRELYQQVDRAKGSDIQKSRQALNYPDVAQKFSLIDNEAMPVAVEYDDQAATVVRQIARRGTLQGGDRHRLQPYLVSLPLWEFQRAADNREEVVPGLWVWRGEYDRSLSGLAIDREPARFEVVDCVQ